MSEQRWAHLMAGARRQALLRNARVRVIGIRSERGGWVYIIECAEGCSVCRSDRS